MTVVVEKSEWITARRDLLTAEKSLQTARDELAAKRRALPALRLDVDYEFLGEQGCQSLVSLFGEQTQLLVYHFMFHPDWDEGCKSCSFWADSFDGAIPHLKARDVAFAVISRGPLDKLVAYKQRMGWSFPWLSSEDSMFNYDLEVSFTPEQVEDRSARGLDPLNPVYQLLDLLPRGRDEEKLPYPMDRVRRNDAY